MFPTAALLVALRLAACPESHKEPFIMDDVGYEGQDSFRYCCNQLNPPTPSHCYEAADHCDVSDATHQCCFKEKGFNTVSGCAFTDKATCTLAHLAGSEGQFSEIKWCPLPAPPASEELSSGAIGGIVVGAYLGVAGAVGAFGVYRGYAAV